MFKRKLSFSEYFHISRHCSLIAYSAKNSVGWCLIRLWFFDFLNCVKIAPISKAECEEMLLILQVVPNFCSSSFFLNNSSLIF